jgi:hypothetical protein
MRILYITNHSQILKQSGGYLNDYLNDLLFYGLTELTEVEVIDSTPIIHLYKDNKSQIPIQNLWGMGFSSTFLIEQDKVDRTNIEEKIKDKYFDLIIYGAVKRCLDYYDLISKIYPNNRIFLIDGTDDTSVHPFSNKHPYFKRELLSNQFIPIHFAIPECKITTNKLHKTQEYGSIIPGQGGYKFNIEQEYYDDYNRSYFGVTMKKAGWDCMRHYEILANNCIPYFIDLAECPKNTLTNLPKELLLEAKDLAENFDEQRYFSILDKLFEYTKTYLTTKELAKYVLEKIA